MGCPVCKRDNEQKLNDIVMMSRNDLHNLITHDASKVNYTLVNFIRCRYCSVIYA